MLYWQTVSSVSTGVSDDKEEGFFFFTQGRRNTDRERSCWHAETVSWAIDQRNSATSGDMAETKRSKTKLMEEAQMREGESDWAIRHWIRVNLGLLVFGKSFMKWETERQKLGSLLLNWLVIWACCYVSCCWTCLMFDCLQSHWLTGCCPYYVVLLILLLEYHFKCMTFFATDISGM